MKRRLALLLALSLTFASVPATFAGAAETANAAETEVVTEIEQEEANGDAVSEQAEESVTEEEAAGQEATEELKETAEAGNGATEAVDTENAEEAVEAGETANEADTEEVAAGTTETEVAAVVEPEVSTVEKEAKEAGKKTGWVNEDGKYYYYNSSSAKLTGWQQIGGHWFYLAPWDNGAMLTGFQKLDGKTYYFNDTGRLVTGGWNKVGSKWYYMNSNGSVRTGWQKIDGKWYYLSGWDNGAMLTGMQKLDGTNYFFNSSGEMATNSWKSSNGKWYYFGSSGAALKGWQKINGHWFYLAPWDNGAMLTGFQKLDGKTYYFNSQGRMATGWQKINGKWYMFHSSGYELFGWQKDGSNWYYLARWNDSTKGWTTGAMVTNWQTLDGVWYYFDRGTGAMVNKPTVLGGALWFFWPNGHYDGKQGWKKLGNSWYYVRSDGMCARSQYIDGYWLDASGRWGGMQAKAQGYSSSTKYLILVDKTTYTVGVFYGSKNNWSLLKEWPCTHGGSKTPNGTWTVDWRQKNRSEKYGWAEFTGSSAAYAYHISAGNYFHSILYSKLYEGTNYGSKYWNRNPETAEVIDPDLYWDGSNGCIRLELQNAKWLWDNVPMGTTVVIYNS